MKKITLIAIAILIFSCEKEKKIEPETVIELQEGYIIGFDPCIRDGHVIVTNDYKDTLVAYLLYYHLNSFRVINRVDTIYKFPGYYYIYKSDTIYQFPDYYYYNYRVDFRFPDTVLNKYRIFLNYRLLKEEEKYPVPCPYDIYPYQFTKHVRDRQIIKNYATKYPIKSVKIK